MSKRKGCKSYTSPKAIRYYLSTYVSVAILLLVQFLILFTLFLALFIGSEKSIYFAIAYILCYTLSLVVVLFIVNRKCNTAYKLAWVVPILIFPGVGGLLYIIVRSRNVHKVAQKRIERNEALFKNTAPAETLSKENANEAYEQYNKLAKYLSSEGFDVFSESEATYLDSGERFHEVLLEELDKAKEYIFMEFFIIHEGMMWDPVLELLEKKAKEGVKIRLMYDGMGSLKTLPVGYTKFLAKKGIDAKIFQPFVPIISNMQNNRDHRKIVVIDGKTALTGGINLSDEYINEYDRFGHWKDSGLLLHGKAAEQYARFFLEMWYTNHQPDDDISPFFGKDHSSSSGLVCPYNDSPIFETEHAKNIYLQLLNHAKKYVYMTTPYLVPGDDLIDAMCVAAKGGLDVRLVTPFHGDKRFVHMISRSYYRELIKAGVKVYEYAPGFIHSKNFLCDDLICSVGSSNLDFRSLYLHYECGALCFGGEAVAGVRKDFEETFPKCIEIKEENLKEPRAIQRLFISVVRLFEPLV